MMNGIWFDGIHSYEDLNLILSSVSIPPAAVKTTYVDIPGGDGSVDLTESSGRVRFKDRDCLFTFTVFPYEDFEEKKKYISNLLNGKQCNIIVDKDPGYYWKGRCFVKEYASNKNLRKIVIQATVAPYKFKTTPTTLVVPAGKSVVRVLENGRKWVIPTITTTEEATIIFEGNTYTVGAGTHTVLNIELKYGDNEVTVTSNSAVTFEYQEGDL